MIDHRKTGIYNKYNRGELYDKVKNRIHKIVTGRN